MQISELIIRYFPGKLGLKIRRYHLRYKGVNIGKHCRLFIGFHLRTKFSKVNIKLGEDVHFSTNTTIAITNKGSLKIGSHVKLDINIELRVNDGHLIIGNYCRISANTMIITGNYIITKPAIPVGSQGSTPSTIIIGDNVWIGVNTVILKGVTIGQNTIIGAGSIVTKSIPPNSIYAGNPAKEIKLHKL